MRVRRRLIAAFLVLALVAPMVAAQDGDEVTVDFAVHVFEDASGDPQGAATTTTEWADLRNGTIHELAGELIFELEVGNVTDRPDDAFWDLGFNTNQTDYVARIRWDGDVYAGQIIAGDSQLGADTNVTVEGDQFLRLHWRDFEDELAPLAILEDTYGASDQSTALDAQQTGCHGSQRIDCAPDEGNGDDFPVGHTPAEGLNLSVTPPNATAFPNTTIPFEIVVENGARNFQGFGYNVTIHVRHPDELAASRIFDDTESLDPGESANRTIDVTIDPDAPTGETYNLTVIAEPEEGLNRTVVVPVTAEAPPPPPPPYALDVDISPARRIADRGDELTYNVTVTNDGANPDVVTLELTDGGDWARLSLNEFTLDSMQSRSVTMTVQVPDDADEQEVRHVVTATSRNDPDVSDSATATTEVDLPGGFVSDLDRTLQDLGLGGLVPFLVIVAIVVILVLYVLGSAMRRRKVVGVDADFQEGEETEDTDGD